MIDADVVIAGGGPIGLATAIEARLAGFDVIVAEPHEGPLDKACGEGLMPGALPALARLGVADDLGALPGMPLRGIAYADGRRRAEHRFAAGSGRGVRRTVLHGLLAARADAVGVRRETLRVGEIATTEDGIRAGGLRARWVIGADGLHSTVARATGLAIPAPRTRRRFGQRRHYTLPPGTDLVEVHWTPLGELYLTPVSPGLLGVAALTAPGVRFADVLTAAPAVAARLAGAEPASDLRGAGPLRQLTRARSAGRVLLVGDASGYVDALTGEGLRIGFGQARAAVEAIAAGDARRYEAAWRRETRDFRRLTGALVRLATSPARATVVPTAAALPGVFGAAVERLAR